MENFDEVQLMTNNCCFHNFMNLHFGLVQSVSCYSQLITDSYIYAVIYIQSVIHLVTLHTLTYVTSIHLVTFSQSHL